MKKHSKLLRGASVLALAGALAACGSSKHASTTPTTSSGSTPGTPTTAATSGSQPTGAPIKVGIICTCSGVFGAQIVPSLDVYKSFADSVNASGGINGHPIEVTVKDDAGNPSTSATDAQALISAGVIAIANLSNFDQTWASAVQSANIPVVGVNLTETNFFSNPDFYPEGQTTDSLIAAVVATAKTAGATNMGSLYCAEAPICQEGVSPMKAAASAAGLPDSFNTEIAATAPSYTAQCVAAKQAKVSSLFIGDGSFVIAKVGQDCAQQSYNPIWLTEGEGFGTVLESAPGIKDNLWSPYNNLPFFDTSNASVQQMNAAVDKYYPGIRNNGNTWSELSAMSWPSGLLLEDAIKAGGLAASDTPTAAEVVKGLEALNADTLQGWSPPLTFAAGKAHSVDCWFTVHMTGGTPALVNNGQTTCATK